MQDFGKLHPRKRKVVAPALAPVFDEHGQLLAIGEGAFRRAGVALTLIPNGAADGVRDQRGDLFAIEERHGPMRVGARIDLRSELRLRLAGRFRFRDRGIVCGLQLRILRLHLLGVEGGDLLRPIVENEFYRGHVLLLFQARPGLDRGAPNAGLDEAHGDAEFGVQLAAKEISRGGK